MNRIISYIFFASVLFSCKTGEIVSNQKEPEKITRADHPYYTAFHKGLRLKLQGRLDEAIQQLDYCLSVRDNDPAVYYALSQLHLMKDNFSLSSEYIKKAAELDPENTWYTQELAYMYYETKDFEKAIENFKKLTSIEPDNIDWLFGYSEALIQKGEIEKAIEVLNQIEGQLGINPQLSAEKYELYMSLGNTEAALNELAVCKKVFPKSPQLIGTYVQHYFSQNQINKAIEMLEELVEADPNNGRAHLALSDIYRQQGKSKESLAELLIAVRSSDVEIDSKMNVLIAVHDQYPGVSSEVMEIVDELVKQHPTDAKSWSMKGDFMLKKGNEEDALKAYRKALEFDKSKYPIWNQVLIMEYQAGMFELLYEDSKECSELFPNVPTVYLLLGVGANLTNHHREAVDALTVGLGFVVNDKFLEAEFHGQLGEAYFGVGEPDNGKKSYKEAIKLDPGSNLIKNNFAFRLATSKTDLDLAESLINQVLENLGDVAQFIDTKGWIMFQKGDYEKAKEIFGMAYDTDPNDGLILEHLGDVNAKLNNTKVAIEWWNKALEAGRNGELLKKKINDGKYYAPN